MKPVDFLKVLGALWDWLGTKKTLEAYSFFRRCRDELDKIKRKLKNGP